MSAFPAFGARAPRDPAALARTILSERRFRVRVTAPPPHTWWDAIKNWLGDRWNQLVDAFSHHVHVGSAASVAAGDLAILASIALVLFVGVRLLLGMARERGVSAAWRPLETAADASALHAAAIGAARRGAYAQAIALLFRAALADLDRRGAIRDDPSRTVNECRRDVRARAPALHAAFDAIARAFTAAVYAEHRAAATDWEEAQRAYETFRVVKSDAA